MAMQEKNQEITVCVSPRHLFRVLATCVLVLVVLHVMGQTSRYVFGYASLKGLVPMFDMDKENVIPAWFSGALLGACALALACISDSVRRRGGEQALFARQWQGLSMLFVFLSIDEICSLHEMMIHPLRQLLNAGGVFYFTWIIPGIIFVVVLLIAYARFLKHLEPEVRNRFLASAAIFVGGAVGIEMIGGLWGQQHGLENLTFALLVAVEESIEMMGAVLFLTSLTHYAIRVQSSTQNVVANVPASPVTGNLDSLAPIGIATAEAATSEIATA